jgi:uncharacterized SAM-binding protein YcdF (DUF218 family)
MSRRAVVIFSVLVLLAAAFVALAMACGASFLRVSNPQRSDVIVVLGGGLDDTRYDRAVELMHAGYAPRILLDTEAFGKKFGQTMADLAQEFLDRTHAQNTTVCPVRHDSTYGEVEDVAGCLAPLKVSSALIVTSDYHTRRAYSIFTHRLPQYRWSVAASYAPFRPEESERMAGDDWWKNRRWAKTILEEWEKLLWWNLVDRWRSGLVVKSSS